jgi:hypothetical protein
MDTQSIRSLRRGFESREPPDLDTLVGTYRREYVGPSWLRRLAGPALGLTALRGWWGKDFPTPGRCENLVSRGETVERVLPVDVVRAVSLLDGKMGITLAYSSDSPRPYRWVVDELRLTETGSLLGMAVPSRRWLPRLALPFMLHPVDREGFGLSRSAHISRGPHSEVSPKYLSDESGSSEARRKGWHLSLDGRRRKRVLVKSRRHSFGIIGG